MPVGEQQESADDEEAERHGQQLCAGKKSDGVANESDQGKGADSAEGVRTAGGLVFFAFKSDEEGQEENEDDLDGFGWQPAVEIHLRFGLL
jgi:hypothetical protein